MDRQEEEQWEAESHRMRMARRVAIAAKITEHVERVRRAGEDGVVLGRGTQPALKDMSRASSRYVSEEAQGAVDEYIRVAGLTLARLEEAAMLAIRGLV
jgi:hypothetical protein